MVFSKALSTTNSIRGLPSLPTLRVAGNQSEMTRRLLLTSLRARCSSLNCMSASRTQEAARRRHFVELHRTWRRAVGRESSPSMGCACLVTAEVQKCCMFQLTGSRRGACSLVIAEHDNKALSPVTMSALEAAKKLGNPICLLVAGKDCSSVCDSASRLKDVSHVCEINHPLYEHLLADSFAECVCDVIRMSKGKESSKVTGKCEGPITAVIAAITTMGKDVLPRVAALNDVQAITDILKIHEDKETFVRPMYAGNSIATVTSVDRLKVMGIRATSFPPSDDPNSKSERAPIASFSPPSTDKSEQARGTEWLKDEVQQSDNVQLATAEVVGEQDIGLCLPILC
eukprot:GHVQ01013065.1.p1 GENE.GHVQ01013065.1~~GHVQ01013065.1.p1  ORF type:complete len:343 (+),score=37.83 GHVQ01013065.1:121-1149(+)